jgi:hypothetical protein
MRSIEIPTKQSQALFTGKTTHKAGDCFALRFDCVPRPTLGSSAQREGSQ